MIHILQNNPNITEVRPCLDHDEAGIAGDYRIAEAVRELGEYKIKAELPKYKDWNEGAKALQGVKAIPSSEHPGLVKMKTLCPELVEGCEEIQIKNLLDNLQKRFEKLNSIPLSQDERLSEQSYELAWIAFLFGKNKLDSMEKKYTKEEYGRMLYQLYIIDNTQLTIFGGFAPNSTSAETLSKSLGSRTVMSGSVSRGKNDPSQSLQMIERPLMTPDELKSMPKGQFVVMKTGFYPMKVKLKLFFKWGIEFEEEYEVLEHGSRKVYYAEKREIIEGIRSKYQQNWIEEYELPPSALPMGGQQQTRTQLRTTPKSYREVNRSE